MDKKHELQKYQFEQDSLLLGFAALPRSVTTVLSTVGLGPPERVIVELDEDGNPVKSFGVSDVTAFPGGGSWSGSHGLFVQHQAGM